MARDPSEMPFMGVKTKGRWPAADAAWPWALIAFGLYQLAEGLLLLTLRHAHSDLCLWDCHWYADLAKAGYDLAPHGHGKADAANWAFFPAFPLSAQVWLWLGCSPQLAVVLSSKLFFLLAIWQFTLWVRSLDERISAPMAALALAASPYAIYGNVGYTESMFMAFSCLFLRLLGSGRWMASGWAGALLGGVRFAGVVAVPAYLVHAWGQGHKVRAGRWREVLWGLLLLPLGTALFMAYLHALTGDALAFSHVQRAWGRVPQNPLGYVLAGMTGSPINQLRVGMVMMAGAMLLWLCWRRQWALAAFTLVCTALPLTTGLWAMPRYIWWQAPVMFVVASGIRRFRLGWAYLVIGSALSAFMYVSWFAGKAFVV
jgi:hypothetical protein